MSTGTQRAEVPLPQNIDAERSVLGAILIDNKSFDAVYGTGLSCEHFFHAHHQKIFQCMLAMREDHLAIDLVTLMDFLHDAGQIDAAGGPGYIASLMDGVPHETNVAFYARIVIDKARLRNIIHLSAAVERAAFANSADLDPLQNKLREAMTSSSALISTNGNGFHIRGLTEFLGMDFPQPEHLIEGLIPKGGSVMIVAMPHRLKSFFTTGLALAATRAGTLLGKLEVPKPVRTILVQVEDPPGEVQKRMRGFLGTAQFMGCDPDNLGVIERTQFKTFDAHWCEWFVRAATEWKADLVIFDVLRRFFIGHGDLNSGVDTAVFLEIIDKIRYTTGAAIVLVHHENRKEAELMWASAGSYNLPGWANVVIQFKRKTEEKNITRVEIEVDNKLANSPEPMRLVLDFTSSNPLMLEALEEGVGFGDAMHDLGGEWTIRDLMEVLQCSRTSAIRRLKKWEELGKIEKIQGGKKGRGGGLARYQEVSRIP